jgi:hypothetical protein
MKTYMVDYRSIEMEPPCIDADGNIYWMSCVYQKRGDTNTIEYRLSKLDNNLTELATFSLWKSTNNTNINARLSVSKNGIIFFLADSMMGESENGLVSIDHHIQIFDSQFNSKADFRASSLNTYQSIYCFGDTVVIKEIPWNIDDPLTTLTYYTGSLRSRIGSLTASDMDSLLDDIPWNMLSGYEIIPEDIVPGPGGIVISQVSDLKNIETILLASKQQEILFRRINNFDLEYNSFTVDTSGSVYFFSLKRGALYKFSRR